MFWKQVLISCLLFIGGLVYGQNIKHTFQLAESQFELQNFDQAEKLYNRVLFFDSSNTFFSVNERLAQIYLQRNQTEKASKYYARYRNFLLVSSIDWINISFKIISIQLASQQNKEAIGELQQMQFLNFSEKDRKRVDLYLAVAYFQDKDFDKSKSKFMLLVDSSEFANVEEIFRKNNRLEKRYNSYRLQIMSSFLPGSGQAYAGYYKEGINSFVLVGAFVALFVHTSKIYGFIDGLISVYPWLSRYHLGGVRKVGVLSKQRIVLKRNKCYHQLLELV